MLLRQLKYFLAIVDTGSFTEAAAQHFISQSAISQQILALEQELGSMIPMPPMLPGRCALPPARRALYKFFPA